MTAKHISLIYFYLISAISLVLIVAGIFHTVNFVINITQYQEYPLRYAGESCESMYATKPLPLDQSTDPTVTAQQKKQCEERISLERKQNKLNDLKNVITFNLVGIILFLIHFPLARKQSNKE